jgi:TolB-like protein/cytochrome c-type biogenesis protein CcmH/NrfG
MNDFFAELKRRNVYKVAVAYIVAGWALSQGIAQVLPVFDIPNWVIRFVVLLIIIGLPVALVLAWMFELTPHGIKRTADVDLAEERSRSHAWVYIVVVGALVSIGLFLAGRYTAGTTTPSPSANQRGTKSIAVLPFVNMSADKNDEYLSDGVSEELINALSKITDLQVKARTSSFAFKGKNEDIQKIGALLHVTHLLEGSVAKAGSKLRITAQLVQSADGNHLWSDTYDREMQDIFAVRTDVAQQVAAALKVRLLGKEKERLDQKPTENLEAYDAYLRGLDLFATGTSIWDELKGVDFLNDAVRLDPGFALAWAKLAEVNARLYFTQFDVTPARKDAARVAAETATKLRPDAPATLLANAFYRYHVLRDYEGARVLFEKIRQEIPSNSEAVKALALVARRQGRWTESLQLFEQAVELNPRDAELLSAWAGTFKLTRQFPAALQILDRALEIRPNNPEILAAKATIYQAEGNLPAAAKVLAKMDYDSSAEPCLIARISQFLFERKYRDAVEFTQKILSQPTPKRMFTSSYVRLSLAVAQDLAGEKAEAKATYAQVRDEMEKFVREQPNNVFIVSGLASAYAGLGDKEAALREGERSLAMASSIDDAVVAPGIEEFFARTETQVGEADRAISRLEHLLTIPYTPGPITQALLQLDPAWDPLRNHPRFQKLVSGPAPKTIYK